jgi:hypothetical protein
VSRAQCTGERLAVPAGELASVTGISVSIPSSQSCRRCLASVRGRREAAT